MQCFRCHTTINLDGQPYRNETCPKCSSYLRCCRNCRFHEPLAHNQCHEPQASWVKDKEMANFCGFFEATANTKSSESSKREEAKKKLNDLFKKK